MLGVETIFVVERIRYLSRMEGGREEGGGGGVLFVRPMVLVLMAWGERRFVDWRRKCAGVVVVVVDRRGDVGRPRSVRIAFVALVEGGMFSAAAGGGGGLEATAVSMLVRRWAVFS